MSKTKIVCSELMQTNLMKNDSDSEKGPYVSNRELVDRHETLTVSNTTLVRDVRRNLFFAREIGVDAYCHLVYAWKWSGDDRYAKIGHSTGRTLRDQMVTTYHPTDDIILIGIKVCAGKKNSEEEASILNRLGRIRPDREWVKINEEFNELINKKFTRIEKNVQLIDKEFTRIEKNI